MKKAKLYILIDAVALFAFLVSLFSGIILWLVLPRGGGFRGGQGIFIERFFLGLTRDSWTDIHNYSSLIFTGIVVYHLVLHWKWIKNIPRMLGSDSQRKGRGI